MGLNDTPSGERIHIGFFGQRNAGKSSVVNAVTGQDLAVVSDVKGTTTDPVQKAMELLPLGPVLIIDTPGFDDVGLLGEKRIQKTKQILNKTDIAILVVDGQIGLCDYDKQLLSLFQAKELPYLIVYNKSDLFEMPKLAENEKNICYVSAKTGEGIHDLKEKIASLAPQEDGLRLVGDLVDPGDFILLVVPIDSAAPKGRLILPQQQVIRDLLDADTTVIVVKESDLASTLKAIGKKPKLVITDSQVFEEVDKDTPEDILLTSFSILMARMKGFLTFAVEGVTAIDALKDGDKVLIAEGCTHHRQCDDIGTVKIPRWLKKYTGKDLVIETCSGTHFPEDLSSYSLIIHCGGCMLNNREVVYRAKCAKDQQIPMTNYGIAIAYMKGILARSVEIFPELLEKLQ